MRDYRQIVELIKDDIKIINTNLIKKLNLQEPLYSQLKDFLNAPAKRIRPLTAVLYLKAHNVRMNENHYKLLSAIELVHNASLIHDDVIDDADLRRCKKTINKTFNPKLAVIAGDYLLACAMDYIKEIDNLQILEEFVQTLAQMCKGEIQQYFNINKIPDLEDYLLKTEQKTAVLFVAALKCSAILAKNINPERAASFARNFGMAFQIKDDLNNVLTTNTDIKNGIYTAPVILSGSIDNLAIENTYDLLNNYINLAQANLNDLEESNFKEALLELTELYRK